MAHEKSHSPQRTHPDTVPQTRKTKDAHSTPPTSGKKPGIPTTRASNPDDLRKERPPAETQKVKTPQGEGEGDGKLPAPHELGRDD